MENRTVSLQVQVVTLREIGSKFLENRHEWKVRMYTVVGMFVDTRQNAGG